jgi:hypothetical protein
MQKLGQKTLGLGLGAEDNGLRAEENGLKTRKLGAEENG